MSAPSVRGPAVAMRWPLFVVGAVDPLGWMHRPAQPRATGYTPTIATTQWQAAQLFTTAEVFRYGFVVVAYVRQVPPVDPVP